MERSRLGYYLRAVSGGDRAARSLGVGVLRSKLVALLLSAAFTAIAGSLYAVMVGFADPDSALGILVSVKMVIMAALGGAGTLFGPLLGAVILIPLEESTNAAFGGSGTGITYVVYGAIILLIARFQPGGLLALWQRTLRRRRAAVLLEAARHGAGVRPLPRGGWRRPRRGRGRDRRPDRPQRRRQEHVLQRAGRRPAAHRRAHPASMDMT